MRGRQPKTGTPELVENTITNGKLTAVGNPATEGTLGTASKPGKEKEGQQHQGRQKLCKH